jgi:DNA-binding HxlR family transcriptional regulator
MSTRADERMPAPLALVGERWTLLILREVWYGASRFSDFERILGCSRNLLAERVRKLVEHGISATEPCQEAGIRSRLRYVITPKGNDLAPAVLGLLHWGDRYRADPAGPAILTRHYTCARHFRCRSDASTTTTSHQRRSPARQARASG